MSTNNQCLVAEYGSIEDADVGYKVLETADFNDETVSIVTRANEQSVEDAGGLVDQTAESPPAQESVAVGGMIGGSLGAALGTATLIGPFMVVGPLVGMAIGAGTGGALAAADRWGLTKNKTEDFEKRVEDGNVLVIVNDSDVRLDKAHRLLQTTGPVSLDRFGNA